MARSIAEIVDDERLQHVSSAMLIGLLIPTVRAMREAHPAAQRAPESA